MYPTNQLFCDKNIECNTRLKNGAFKTDEPSSSLKYVRACLMFMEHFLFPLVLFHAHPKQRNTKKLTRYLVVVLI